ALAPGRQQDGPAAVALLRELALAVHEAAVLALDLRDRDVDPLQMPLGSGGVHLPASLVARAAVHRQAAAAVGHVLPLQLGLGRGPVLARSRAALQRPIRDPRGVDLLPLRVAL